MSDGFSFDQWSHESLMKDIEQGAEPEPPETDPEKAPLFGKQSWILEKRPDGSLLSDLAFHRCARLVPARFRAHVVEVPGPLVTLIKAWSVTPGACLYLTGPLGTGKTQLAWVAALAWLDKHRAGSWDGDLVKFRAARLFEELYRSYDQRDGLDIAGRCMTARLMFLDDLGTEKDGAASQRQLTSIVDARYEHQRPMLVTSNYSPAELEDHQEPRLVSRLVHMCEGGRFVVHVGGDDRRRP
jgi:predicted ATPase